MPLPPSDSDRELLHRRNIVAEGYRRRDGLFEVEARLTDTKTTEAATPAEAALRKPGGVLHDILLRLVFDENMKVHDIVAFTEAAPYPACPNAHAALGSLKGLSMSSGWSRTVRERLGGVNGCTHLVELLGPAATTAFQTLAPLRMSRPDPLDANGRPVKIDSCHAYARDGELVKVRWPAFYEARGGKSQGGER